MAIGGKLVLFGYLVRQFGYEKFEDLQKKFYDEELKAETTEGSVFFSVLGDKVRFSPDDLQRYDENIIEHLSYVNRQRRTKINLKYYQYLSLLFTEYYLDHYYADKDALHESLEQFRIQYSGERNEFAALSTLDRDDLNLVAYWQATGSGKTFTLHFNILQYRHYVSLYKAKLNNLILLAPSETLSRQHLKDLEESGIEADYYLNNKAGDHVKVIDLYKIGKSAKGQGVTVPVAEFGQENALFVDEGHKGNDKEEGVWRGLREEMGYNGFTFEYSATFGQVSQSLQDYYGKSIIFDYSYKFFHTDGYGKNYRIHNITESQESDNDTKRRYLLCNLLLFTQQKLYYKLNQKDLEVYQIDDPLLIFVGHTVNPKAKGKEAEENDETISDVKILLEFWQDFLSDRGKYEEIIREVFECQTGQFCREYYLKLNWLFSKLASPREGYDAVLKYVLNAETQNSLELYTLKEASGEIALKVKNNEHYFGLINIGDVSKFKSSLEGETKEESKFVFHKASTTTASLFETLSDKSSAPINILIGARKFIEGWNNYRVSSIGLINFGKSEGAQIIQLFGRGVRLRGKENSLKRSTENDRLDADMPIVETLNIFGLNADYMKRFEDDLKAEGILKRTFEITIPTQLYRQQEGIKVGSLNLIVPQKEKGAKPFNDTNIVELSYDGKTDARIKVLLDLTTKSFAADSISGQTTTVNQGIIKNTLQKVEKFIDYHKLFLDLIRYKRSKGYHNLKINKASLEDLLSKINFELKLDNALAVKCLADIERVQRIALQLLEKYARSYYERHLRVYEGKHLESGILNEDQTVLSQIDYTVEVAETDGDGNPIEGIDQIRKQLEELAHKARTDISALKGSSILCNAWFDQHLYQPLLLDSGEQPTDLKIESIKPKGLNRGERIFVAQLAEFIKKSRSENKYEDCEFYLLRNSSVQTRGFGFYFSASGGFFPDFLLWIKHGKGKGERQYLTFIDPHGLRQEDGGFMSDKIQLHKFLQTEFPKVRNLILNSFVLSVSKFDLSNMRGWEKDQEDVDLRTYSNSLNVYELGSEGNIDYLSEIVDKVLTNEMKNSQAESRTADTETPRHRPPTRKYYKH